MKTSFWRRWYQSLLSAKPTGRISRARARRQPLVLLALEDRVTPTLTPQMVLDINATGGFGSNLHNPTDVNGTLFFAADDGPHGIELWKSDGTAAGTTLVKDIYPGGYIGGNYGYSSSPSQLTKVNGTLFFTAEDSSGFTQLWKSDGTAAGTVLVSALPWVPTNLTNVNGTLFFTAGDYYYGSDGAELWKSDGTSAGTTLVKDIYPGTHFEYDYNGNLIVVPNSSSPRYLTSVNGTLYFMANNGVNGRELWKSDGTATGTMLVKDICPGTGDSEGGFTRLTVADGLLYLTANDGAHGAELWKSDGTPAGTAMVKDIRAGSAGSNPHSQANADGTLFFSADDGTHGHELWKSDGTAAGTTLVKDINLGSDHSYPRPGGRIYTGTPLEPGASVNGTLFFSASDGVHGRELWKSNGTTAGTVLVKDIDPGTHLEYDYYGNLVVVPNSSFPSYLTSLNETLYFAASDDLVTTKLWQSDGTAASTVLVSDDSVNWIINVSGTLFFASDDGVHGYELWKLVELAAPTVTTVTINDGSAQRSRVTSVAVTFNSQVEFAGTVAGAFTLSRNGGKPVSFKATASVVNGTTVVTLSNFTGMSTQFGSLSDGRYTLTALANQISVGGVLLDGDGDGQPGGNFTFGDAQGLFRMFGDVNGDRQVDGADFSAFSYTYASFSNQSNYLWFLDINGDGQIDGVEFSQFSGRYNTLLP